MELTQVNNNGNGNPRYVVHFLSLINNMDNERAGKGMSKIPTLYEIALEKSRELGGRKFHNKQYGGGIAFEAHNPDDLIKDLERIRQEK